MNPLALFDPAVAAAHHLVVLVAATLPLPPGGGAFAVALACVTLLTRAAMLPLAVLALRAGRAQERIAPLLAEARRRHRNDPQRLIQESRRIRREAGVAPLAGVLPALAQLPVLVTTYRLVVVPVIAGSPNLVLRAQLFGAPLGAHWPEVIAAGGVLGAGTLALVVGLVLLLVLATLSSREIGRRTAQLSAADPAAALEAGSVHRVLRLLPYGTVVVAAFSPVAVGTYLVVSTAWSVTERRVLPRLIPA